MERELSHYPLSPWARALLQVMGKHMRETSRDGNPMNGHTDFRQPIETPDGACIPCAACGRQLPLPLRVIP